MQLLCADFVTAYNLWALANTSSNTQKAAYLSLTIWLTMLRSFASLPFLVAPFILLLYARENFFLCGPANREAPGLH